MAIKEKSLTIRPPKAIPLADFKHMAKFTDNWHTQDFSTLEKKMHTIDLIEDQDNNLLGWAVCEHSGKNKIVVGMEWLQPSGDIQYPNAQYVGSRSYDGPKTPAQFLLDHMLAQMEISGHKTLNFSDIMSGRDDIARLVEPYQNDPRISIDPPEYFANEEALFSRLKAIKDDKPDYSPEDILVIEALMKLKLKTGIDWEITKINYDNTGMYIIPMKALPKQRTADNMFFRTADKIENPVQQYRKMASRLGMNVAQSSPDETSEPNQTALPLYLAEKILDTDLDDIKGWFKLAAHANDRSSGAKTR